MRVFSLVPGATPDMQLTDGLVTVTEVDVICPAGVLIHLGLTATSLRKRRSRDANREAMALGLDEERVFFEFLKLFDDLLGIRSMGYRTNEPGLCILIGL